MKTTREYLQGLSKIVALVVGDKLSAVEGREGLVPSVFIARQKPPKASYPYGSCDYVGEGNYGLRKAYSSNDGTKEISEFNRRLTLRVAFYGKYSDSVIDIAKELKNTLLTSKGQEYLGKEMEGAGLMQVSEVGFNSPLITTDYEEFSFITLDFWVIDIVETETGSIDTIMYDGELYQNSYKQEEEPLIINRVITDQEL